MNDLDTIMKDHERLASKGKNDNFLNNFVKMPEGEGTVILRILPAAASGQFNREKSPIYQTTRIHALDGTNVHCLRELDYKDDKGRWLGECPVCSFYSYLWQEAEKKGRLGKTAEMEDLKNQARKLKPIERFYYNAIVRGKEAEGPKILSVGKQIQDIILAKVCGDPEEGTEGVIVWDPKVGCDLKIKREIQGEWGSYKTSKFLVSTPTGSPEDLENWMNALHDLVSLRNVKSYDEAKNFLKKYLGQEPDTSSVFDPSEYTGGHSAQPVAPPATTVVVEDTSSAPFVSTETVENDGEEKGLVDEEYVKTFQELRKQFDN